MRAERPLGRFPDTRHGLGAAKPATLIRLVVHSTRRIRDAPHRAPGAVMSCKEEANLFRHYGAGSGSGGPSAGKAAAQSRTSAGRIRGTGRTMLHKYAVPSAGKAS